MPKDIDHKEVFENIIHYTKRNVVDLSSDEYLKLLDRLRDYVKLLNEAWPESPEYL